MASSRPAPVRVASAALRRGLGFGIAVALLSGPLLSGAAAQGFYREIYGPPRGVYFNDDGVLPPREIVEGLHERGFSEVGRPRFDGRTYRVEATSPRGMRMRLVLDAREGDVLGREPLGAYYPSERVRPAAPGYGWTEDDLRPRRLREAERIVPPADIPSVPALRPAPLGPEREASRALRAERVPPAGGPEANPLGLNPDAAARTEAPRRAARPAPSPETKTKPAQARIAPPAPEPSLRSGQGAPASMPAARSEPEKPAAREAKAVEPSTGTPKPDTQAPAPAKEPAKDTARESAKEPAKEPAKTADSAPAKPAWQDPPADGPRKNVRVIGGATVVPGGTGEAGGN